MIGIDMAIPRAPPSNIPIPDPSLLTIELLRHEMAGLREVFDTRMDAFDRAMLVERQEAADGAVEVEKQMMGLKELHGERFSSIQLQFRERDVRSDQDKIGATTAVNAALSAQKESAAAQNASNAAAITKSEAATAKEIDGIKLLLNSNAGALTDKIEGINARLNRGDGITSAHSAGQATMLAVAAVVIALVVGAFAILGNGSHSSLPIVSPTPVVQAPATVVR